ncbi:expressed unknown protein [Seminavis robusta]|uniref:Uncharacterized protein n=1 Tax=Seminavis robusta TaxID=568900 RepID=A0A9N8HUV9_9STRA|nr:expressed unknown protein [Seminavis robusta]|eukprot:Sro1435_g272340.1 n/a (306) ;mRNA; f:2519-3506
MLADGEAPTLDETAARAAKRHKTRVAAEVGRATITKCDFDVLLLVEKSCYENDDGTRKELRGQYVPGKADSRQLKKASKEFCRRALEGLGSIPPFVLVARNIPEASIPSPYEIPSDFEVSVSGTKISVHKIVLVHYGGDLYIVKIASGPTHAQAVTEIIGQIHPYKAARRDIFDFASDGIYEMPGTGGHQATFGGNRKNFGYAPDYGILSTYPFQQGIALLRGVFIAEAEVFNRDAAALVSRMSEYAKIPQNKYLLAMKIYKDRVQHVHHSAIAVLWKRNRNSAAYDVQEIMNFGLLKHSQARGD